MNDKFAKIRQLPGAKPPGPPTGICPGPNEGITARGPQTPSGLCVHFISSLATPLAFDVKYQENPILLATTLPLFLCP